MLLLFY